MSFFRLAAGIVDFSDDKDIGFIVGDASSPYAGDAAIKAHIEARGYTVTYIDDNSATGNEAHDAFIISSSVSASLISNKYINRAAGIVNMEYLNWVDNSFCTIVGSDFDKTQWDLVDDTHPIANGFSNGLVTIFNTADDFGRTSSTGEIGAGATTIFDSPSGGGRRAVIAYSTGSALISGTAAGRRVTFPIKEGIWSNTTADLKTIFDNALDWALGII